MALLFLPLSRSSRWRAKEKSKKVKKPEEKTAIAWSGFFVIKWIGSHLPSTRADDRLHQSMRVQHGMEISGETCRFKEQPLIDYSFQEEKGEEEDDDLRLMYK